MQLIDWSIVIIFLFFLTLVATVSSKWNRSVADFLAAGRCAGRYLVSISQGMAQLGVVGIIASFQIHYEAGFNPLWWQLMLWPVGLIITFSGWIIYRYRQTRVLTLAQFFEIRYSKKFRIFAGLLAFVTGIVNFGIFPAVGARFFMFFCRIPETLTFVGFEISSFLLVMIVLLSISTLFTFYGQIVVLITDFFQGVFTLVVCMIVFFVMLKMFNWQNISEAMMVAPKDASLVHPFQTGEVENFNIVFYLIEAFGMFYTFMCWQGSQAYNCSAKSPHEAKMGQIISGWRWQVTSMLFCLLSICAYTVINHPSFLTKAEAVNSVLSSIKSPQIANQLTVPIVLREILPTGIIGLFCSVMVAGFICTHDTYLHSWGSILIQDVIMPLRGKPLSSRQHIWLLRFAILAVAVFTVFFSLLFRQTQHIILFFRITGAIFLGGAGSAIIGGLYWKRGTTAAAWGAVITGSVLAVLGVVIKQFNPEFFLNGQVMSFIAMVSSITVYVVISLLSKTEFNIDKMLHRGKYADQEEDTATLPPIGFKALLPVKDSSLGDKIIYIATYTWTFVWFTASLVISIYNLKHDVKIESWLKFWHFYVILAFIIGIIVTIWVVIGGSLDLKYMIKTLRTKQRDDKDDGMVIDN